MPDLDLGAAGRDAITAAVFLMVFLLVVFGGGLWRLSDKTGWRPRPSRRRPPRADVCGSAEPYGFDLRDVQQQLRAVMDAPFEKSRLLNVSESKVFSIIEREVAAARRGYRLFAQTSLGEIVRSPSENAYRSVNSKRVDMLVVDPQGWPALAIEYQGSGHYQGTAAARDAIKKEALRKAGVRYLVIDESDSEEFVRVRVREKLDLPISTATARQGHSPLAHDGRPHLVQ